MERSVKEAATRPALQSPGVSLGTGRPTREMHWQLSVTLLLLRTFEITAAEESGGEEMVGCSANFSEHFLGVLYSDVALGHADLHTTGIVT